MVSHDHAVLIASVSNALVTITSPRLSNVLDTVLRCHVDVVAERKESVRGERNPSESFQELFLLLFSERLGGSIKELEPCLAFWSGHIGFIDVRQLSVESLDALATLLELESTNLRVLAKVPDSQLGAGKLDAIHSALLTSTNADHLTTLRETNRVGLGVLRTDGSQNAVNDSALRHILILGYDVLKHFFRDNGIVPFLSKAKTVNLTVFVRWRLEGNIALEHKVPSFLLAFKDLKGFLIVPRSNDSVADFTLKDQSSLLVHLIRKSNKISKRRLRVSVTSTDVGGSQRSQSLSINVVDLSESFVKGHADSSSSRRHVLKGGGSRKVKSGFELENKLPSVHSIQKVDVSRVAVENLEWHLGSVLSILSDIFVGILPGLRVEGVNGGKFLVWVASVLEVADELVDAGGIFR
mmetsp:Transcript_1792/g.3449  ORF Transcript_1792/g.3449 Transcript_1792/m.3449 type:complete len:410 (+) Transcript_1792:300-1529(+)